MENNFEDKSHFFVFLLFFWKPKSKPQTPIQETRETNDLLQRVGGDRCRCTDQREHHQELEPIDDGLHLEAAARAQRVQLCLALPVRLGRGNFRGYRNL